MNQADAERWKSDVLDEIFIALAESPSIEESLVFKGARVLNIRLSRGRQSLDIDSNLTTAFVARFPDREEQRQFLEREMKAAIRRHFEAKTTVRFQLVNLQVRNHPPKGHPMGWDAFEVKINVEDLTKSVRGLPALTIDVAAPEAISEASVSRISVGGHLVYAYTLPRIAGEKLRAFLSSLPAYRVKAKKPGEAVRARDLYDVANIRRSTDLVDSTFWTSAGQEFHSACKSRFVDCAGLETFQEQWDVTKKTYSEASIPKDISFEEAETTLVAVVEFFELLKIIPFAFPLRAV